MKLICKLFGKIKPKTLILTFLALSGVTLTPELIMLLNQTT